MKIPKIDIINIGQKIKQKKNTKRKQEFEANKKIK